MADPPVCLDCGATATPEQTCRNKLDHRIGTDHDLACTNCGRLAMACAMRPCQAVREQSYEPGWADEDTGGNEDG
jgi:hypothetical protein